MKDELILALVDKFQSGALAELDYQDGSSRLILKSAGEHKAGALTGENNKLQSADVRESGELETSGRQITSPIVGTFYSAPGPDSPSFVHPGSRVKAGDTLCILEAMKMMNHLEAEFDCEIRAVKAASGDLVEFGQVLFEVDKI
ncbi:MAG: acetyl-CoA carboxylase biotin carboxyl carrier protein subunit [Treponema sp.]|jgi:acetyl-CoA carboxylase biotin carboxyl carrier protein|nr:acetyl-CoA carboxylase biotin carboxyl carrier protein subunit [Treponema sp.]